MPSLFDTCGRAIRKALLSNPALIAAVGDAKYVIQEATAADLNSPVDNKYVVFEYLAGGNMNQSPRQDFDVRYMVTGIATNLAVAKNLADIISDTLSEREIDYANGFAPYTVVTELYPMADNFLIEGKVFWRVGAVYRLRGVK